MRGILIVGGVAFLVVLLVAGPTYYGRYREYRNGVGDPAERLPALRTKIIQAGLTLAPDGADPTLAPNVQFFRQVSEEFELVESIRGKRATPDVGAALVSDRLLGQRLASVPSDLGFRFVPKPTDIIVYPSTMTERRIGANVAAFAYQSLERNNQESSVASVEFLNHLCRVMARDASANGVAATFGTQVDICRIAYGLWRDESLSKDCRSRLVAVLEDESSVPGMKAFLQAEFDKIIAATRGFDTLSESERLDLSSGEDTPPLDDSTTLMRAMESDVIAYWSECLDTIDTGEPELAAAIMDKIAVKWQEKKVPSRYMVRTMGQVFEQQARMISRMAQARYLLVKLLKGDYTPSMGEYAGVRVYVMDLNLDGREGLAAPSAAGPTEIRGDAEFWIDQRGGVFAQTRRG